MGDEEQGGDVAQQELFEPQDGVYVQMVCGLIEEQKIRLPRERPSKQDTTFLSPERFSMRSSLLHPMRDMTLSTDCIISQP